MREIYENNKITIWIGIATIIILVVGLVIYFQKDKTYSERTTTQVVSKDDYNLVLFGDDVEIYQNGNYQEPGYYAILNNDIVTDKVIVDNPLDVTTVGEYEIKYTYRTLTKTRTVKVLEDPNSKKKEEDPTVQEEYDIKLTLNGDSVINLKINEAYKELGAKAIDSKGSDLSNEINISGTIDTNSAGTYKIKYTISKNGISKSLERVINVLNETNLIITAPKQTNYINKDITISVEVIGNNYSYMKLPNNDVTRDSKLEYVIKENGTYTFQAFDKDNQYKAKRVTVKNIDKIKPSGSCTATIENSKTTINVSAIDNVGINYYLYNGKERSNTNTYTYDSVLNNASVIVYDKANNSTTISCSIINKQVTPTPAPTPTPQPTPEPVKIDEGNLEIHFMVSGHDDDAILIRNNKYTIMIDGGRYEDKKNVIPYLQNLGVKDIDLLIGSHVHWNHIQAQSAIIESFNVKKAIYSIDIFNCKKQKICDSNDIKYILNTLTSKNIPTEMKAPGDFIELGEIKIYFIGPLRANKSHNANSFVFILKYRDTSYMFTGDAESKDMDAAKLQANANKWNINLDVDLLKWPHHGYNQLTDALFKATTPKYIFIPSGGCSKTYPKSSDKSLIKKYGSIVYSRCDNNVVLISDGKNIDIKTNQNASDYKR